MKIKQIILIYIFMLANVFAFANEHTVTNDTSLFKGGFGELHYLQPVGDNSNKNGQLNVHRLVISLGYAFSEKFHFFGEIAYEHVAEVLVEQVYVNYEVNHTLNLKAGLLPIPMGIVNQEHEPDCFNGVEHPAMNQYLIPTAWRELGVGIHGELNNKSLKYQLYLINGFATFKEGEAKANGMEAFRPARQEGVKSFISHPNVAGRLQYDGIKGLQIGVSGYMGETQSELYDQVSENVADSTVVNLNMLGVDFKYNKEDFYLRGEWVYNNISNTEAYNRKTNQDLGKAMMGYYLEIAYNILPKTLKRGQQLLPFIRYGHYDTHHKVSTGMTRNKAYEKEYITTGLTYHWSKNVIFKCDYQKITDKNMKNYDLFNIGINFVF